MYLEETHPFLALYPEITLVACVVMMSHNLRIETVEVGEESPLEVEQGEVSAPETNCSGGGPAQQLDADLKENSGQDNKVKKTGKRKATIMVAGRPRNGKSTALNNIFGLNLTAKASAKSVTQVVNVNEVTKKIEGEKDGEKVKQEVTLRVIDTPGLGANDITKETIIKDMQKVISGEDYTLMYCLSVAPNTILLETDKAIIQNLHHTLGKEVWNKCVLLLTFSDYARDEFDDSEEDYINYIDSHAHEFQVLLKSIGADLPSVKTVFECQSQKIIDKEKNPDGIVAIPVNKKPKKSEEILPGILEKDQDWTDIAFVELMKKTGEESREPFVFFRYPNLLLGTSTAGAGAAMGAAAGAALGILGGPIGVYAGAGIGAVMGGAAGSMTAFTIKGVINLVKWMKN